jgi:hypothetical protein
MVASLSEDKIEISVPRDLSALIINSVSLECSGRIKVEGVWAKAASTSARFVADLDPGMVNVAEIGLSPLNGACQSLIMEFYLLD